MRDVMVSVGPGAVRSDALECVRRIGLAGSTLAQLRTDFERKPTPWVRDAILSKVAELVSLASTLGSVEIDGGR